MKIISADFITGAVKPVQFQKSFAPEFAFAGKSNVGKSSLINSLVNRRKLVRTSQTPGKTQMINFFSINGYLTLADLPGYGFAKVPDCVQKNWKGLIESYLLKRENLKGIVFILDVRRGFTELDGGLKEWLDSEEKDYVLVATKADKLKKAEKKSQLEKIREVLPGGQELISYSSKTPWPSIYINFIYFFNRSFVFI